jgi:signal transduction histidine kinase
MTPQQRSPAPSRQSSLLWKILFSTSLAITVLFGITGWLVQKHATDTISLMLQDEVRASFQAYDSLWRSRARNLASVSRVLSSMSDVRAAFSTQDRATIRDTAGELWTRISDPDAMFLVADPEGRIIASLGGEANESVEGRLGFIPAVLPRFPEQVSGFVFVSGRLFQVSVTPVYVQSGGAGAQTLLNVVVAGYPIRESIAQQLKSATGGSEFLFAANGTVLASSMPMAQSQEIATQAHKGVAPQDFMPLRNELKDLNGNAIAELWILRSLESAKEGISRLRRNIFLIYVFALLVGLGVTAMLARRLVAPIRELDRAAAEVARQNYDTRVEVQSSDEIGRLAATFNAMCASIQKARSDLIRHERIATIGQLSTSIVHDLRNPLAAIYGGAEMLVDGQLSGSQVQRLAANIYKASRHIQELLQELSDISRGKTDRTELCRLRDVVVAGLDPVRALAESSQVEIAIDVPEDLEVPLARARMERVFSNLLVNAVQAMKSGGRVEITARREGNQIMMDVKDNGPGISPEIRDRLFEPFVSEGKKNGLGLGLALSRQTVLSHGGDLWLAHDGGPGAHFRLRLGAQNLGDTIEAATANGTASPSPRL